MRVAALYDIHGNLPALEAVLEDIACVGADRVVVGGDVVPGPMPRETLVRLLELDIPFQFIVGNGELAVLAEMNGQNSGVPARYRDSIRWNACTASPVGWRIASRMADYPAYEHERNRQGSLLSRYAAKS